MAAESCATDIDKLLPCPPQDIHSWRLTMADEAKRWALAERLVEVLGMNLR